MKKIEDWHGEIEKIGIATDHGGFEMKMTILTELQDRAYKTVDYGPHNYDSKDDYPDYAGKLSMAVSKGEISCGILICRSGVGMGINANRFHGVRAANASNPQTAELSRSHNCSNILILAGNYIHKEDALKVMDKWLKTPFSFDERHIRRLEKLERNSYDDIAGVRHMDPEITRWLDAETERQRDGIELIASENFTSCAVRASQASVLTNKYAEGYPGKRYYNGCEFVDKVEQIAIDRACELFGAEAANVQPHSGSQANMGAYFALIEPGDTILAMSLDHGGHLTHGHPMNFSGMLYNIVPYGVDRETELIDYDEIESLALKHKPKLIVAGASAYSRTIDFASFREIADKIGAKLMTDMAHIAGLVATGEHINPVPFCDVVTTTTHKTLRGPRAGLILCKKDYIKKIKSRVFPGLQGGPLMHVIAAKAVCFKEAMSGEFKIYQHQVRLNAARLAEELKKKGLRIVSGGTDNHLMLLDLCPVNMTGKLVSNVLDKAGITVNKNMIPFDPEKPFVTSGIRLGTPAVTTRGMKEDQMENIADFIERAVSLRDDEQGLAEIKTEVAEFMEDYPMPQF